MASQARNGVISQEVEGKSTTNSGPPRKRQRVSRACDQCRSSREKCDGDSPCATCTNHGRECTWNTPKKTRGLKTGYIRTLESALAWTFNHSPGVEPALCQVISNRHEKFNEPTEQLLQTWKTSAVRKKIEQLVSKGDQGNHDSSSDGETQSLSSRFSAMPSTRIPALNSNISPSLPENTLRLLDIYFSYTHNWFPILDKALVQKAAWSYSHQPRPDVAHSPELWALLALASLQEESLHSTQTPNELYAFARSLIFTEEKHDASHVKALLLLTLINIGRQETESAWVLIGFACNLRFHLSNDWRSKYVLMGCALLDLLLSSHLARPRHMIDDLELPIEVDVQDEWEEWTSCEGFGIQSSTRFPARSISSFRSLYSVQFQGMFDVDAIQLGTPSASILRVAASSNQGVRQMLSAVEEFVHTFGIYAIPPLFSHFMALKQDVNDLSVTEHERWMQMQSAAQALYTPGSQLPVINLDRAIEAEQTLIPSLPVEDDFNLTQDFALDANLDYDAIMNEISIVDSRDLNAQFMINLGFDPESSMDDMFSYNYGNIRFS